MSSPNFAARVYLAFDAPSAASPTWVEITGFVQQEAPITITPGRADGLSDVNNSTCTLTVDNTDGRFSEANKAGTWYGQLHKGNWLKVELTPPSGIVSQRFVGFVNSLPNQWQGQTQFGQITASDRYEKLGASRQLVSMIQHEVLTDPNLVVGNPSGSVIQAYYNLHEAQGSTTFGDTSGNLARYLSMASIGGVPAGTGFAASNVDAPGFDGLQAVTFNPPSTSQGTYLTAPITFPTGTWSVLTYTGLMGTIEFWFQSITANAKQFLVSAVDPIAQVGATVFLDADGFLNFSIASSTPTNATFYFSVGITPSSGARLDDGRWHHVVVGMSAGSGNAGYFAVVDGVGAGSGAGTNSSGGIPATAFTQLIIGAGYDWSAPGFLKAGAANISDVAWLWADLYSTNVLRTNTNPPDIGGRYLAGTSGFSGESTDQRVARIARYAGVPIPLAPATDVLGFNRIHRYNPIKGPWTNLSVGAHQVGTQSIAGRAALDVMREAARTEGMPLYVNQSGYLALQASTVRQNTNPAWTMDALELDPSTAVANDFAYLTNQMTVTPNSGAEQTVVGVAGSPGQLSQAKYGEYDGSAQTASLNPIEAQSLGLGVIQLRADPQPRFAPIAVEAATAALLPGYGSAWYDAVLATDISTPIRVTNAPAAVGGGNYDCLVEGWTETITAGNHLFQFSVSPVQGPTYQLDDAVLGRLDTDGSTLVGALNTTATTFTVATTSATGAAWTTASADFPFDILMDTEQMTVTSVAPVSIGVDGTFETSATGWTLSGCTLVQSTSQAHAGTHSGLMTSTTTGTVSATTPQFAVNGGATYQPSHWIQKGSGSPTADLVTVSWFTSGATLISTVTSPRSLPPPAAWQQQVFSATAPSNAAFATVKIQFTSAASGNAIFLDDVVFTLLTGGQQAFTVTRSVNSVIASHLSGAALALAEPLTLAY